MEQQLPGPQESGLAQKIFVGAAGSVVTAAGVVMFVTPGPGIILVLAGMTLLSREFAAPRRVMHRIRERWAPHRR
jgi:hypothetical protein